MSQPAPSPQRERGTARHGTTVQTPPAQEERERERGVGEREKERGWGLVTPNQGAGERCCRHRWRLHWSMFGLKL